MLRVPRATDVAQTTGADFETAMRDFGHWMEKALAFVENRYGIGVVERSCLEFLAARPEGSRQDAVGEYLRLSVGETRALVSRLARRGYARRERAPSDPDVFIVHAVSENNDVMAIVAARRALLDGVLQNFDPEERAVIARYAGFMTSIHPARLVEAAEQQAARTRRRG